MPIYGHAPNTEEARVEVDEAALILLLREHTAIAGFAQYDSSAEMEPLAFTITVNGKPVQTTLAFVAYNFYGDALQMVLRDPPESELRGEGPLHIYVIDNSIEDGWVPRQERLTNDDANVDIVPATFHVVPSAR